MLEQIMEIFTVLENKPGQIGELTRILKKKRISIFALGLFGETARLHVSHPEKALEALQENGYEAELHGVLRVTLPNREGVLSEMTQKLGNAGINIKYMYGAMEEQQKRGSIVFEVDDPELALSIFVNHRF